MTRDGRVISRLRRDLGDELAAHKCLQKGYWRVSIKAEGGGRVTLHVHRLVGKVFLPNPDGLPEIDHVDGNKDNNCEANLEWVSHAENLRRARARIGNWSACLRNGSTSKAIVETCEETGKQTWWPSAAEFSRVHGGGHNLCPNVSTALHSQVGQVAYGSTWRFAKREDRPKIMRATDDRVKAAASTNLPPVNPLAVPMTMVELVEFDERQMEKCGVKKILDPLRDVDSVPSVDHAEG